MNDSQSNLTEHEPVSPPPRAVDPPPEATTRSRNRRILIIGGLVAAGLCLCTVLCVVAVGTGAVKALLERDDVERVVDEFMQAMAGRDIDSAYAFISTRSKRTTPRSELEELLQGNNYMLFDGYESLHIASINLGARLQTNPDLPQGTVATVSGQITYEGGYNGRFEAILEQEEDEWRIHSIRITVPPDKLDND